MAFRTQEAETAFWHINRNTLVEFQELTSDIDLFETAVAEYDGVILQLLLPNPVAGYPKFQLLKTNITLAEPTSYFRNENGSSDLTVQEVIDLVNDYINMIDSKYNNSI